MKIVVVLLLVFRPCLLLYLGYHYNEAEYENYVLTSLQELKDPQSEHPQLGRCWSVLKDCNDKASGMAIAEVMAVLEKNVPVLLERGTAEAKRQLADELKNVTHLLEQYNNKQNTTLLGD